MKPRDLPGVRAEMLDFYMTEFGQKLWHRAQTGAPFADGKPLTLEQSRDLFVLEAKRWMTGDLYFVSKEMTDLALEAALTLPATLLRPEDLPSEKGLLVFESGIAREDSTISSADHFTPEIKSEIDRLGGAQPIVAVAWSPMTGREEAGVWLGFYASLAPGHPIYGQVPFAYEDERLIPFNVEQDIPAALRGLSNLNRVALAVFSSWLLMKQKIAVVDSLRLERQQRRAIERKGHSPEVRVITIRGHQRDDSTGESDREYHHRWIVRGHWRNQWYASQERHIPLWIAPHIKGPEGAPVLGGDKVYSWTR